MNKRLILVLGGLLMLCGVIAIGIGWRFPVEVNRGFESKRNKLLEDASLKAEAVALHRAAEFKAFVIQRSHGINGFAEDVISLDSSLIILGCKWPTADKDCFDKFIQQKMGQHLFTPQELESKLNQLLEAGQRDLQTIEDELAHRLKHNGLKQARSHRNLITTQVSLQSVSQLTKSAAHRDAARSVVGLVATELVTSIGTHALTRAATSIGLLTLSSSNAWWTFGTSMLIGLLANEAWQQVTQPARSIEEELRQELARTSSKGQEFIRSELSRAASTRIRLWQTSFAR